MTSIRQKIFRLYNEVEAQRAASIDAGDEMAPGAWARVGRHLMAAFEEAPDHPASHPSQITGEQ